MSKIVLNDLTEAFMIRKASAVWNGGLKDGKGTISTESGALDKKSYGFVSRFESGAGTNPEELIAAAHAGCPLTDAAKTGALPPARHADKDD